MTKLLYALAALFILTLLGASCRGSAKHPTVVDFTPRPDRVADVRRLLTDDSVTPWIPATLDMPDGNTSIEYRRVGTYAEVFNDSNYVHWAEAEIVGITPMTDTRSHWDRSRGLEKVVPCADFYVEELNYSVPYLVPRAARLLHEIGYRFHAAVKERTGADYRIKVTSVLRTPALVRRLQRINKNAVDSSTHTLATTFDISYARYICDNPSIGISADALKGVLAEVLYDIREEGVCFIKYEQKQPCFHISCRDYQTLKSHKP